MTMAPVRWNPGWGLPPPRVPCVHTLEPLRARDRRRAGANVETIMRHPHLPGRAEAGHALGTSAVGVTKSTARGRWSWGY